MASNPGLSVPFRLGAAVRWSGRGGPRPAIWLVGCLLALVLAGCGRAAEPEPLAREWPLALPQTGVIGYLSARLDAASRDAILDQAVGWHPGGVDPGRPLTLLHLDERTFGGTLAVLLPIGDEGAFRASLTASPVVESLGRDRWRLVPDPESGLMMALQMSRMVLGGSPAAMLPGLGETLQPVSLVFDLEVADGWALAAPSFESLGVLREVRRQTDGFAQAPRAALVASLDVRRFRVAYAEDIRKAQAQVEGLLSGAATGGMLATMAGAAGHFGGGPRGPGDGPRGKAATPAGGLPISGEVVWALLRMLPFDAVVAAQVTWPESPAPPADRAVTVRSWSDFTAAHLLEGGAVQVALDPALPAGRVALALRPGPPGDDLAGAPCVLAADPVELASAVAEWARPLGEVVKGQGAPCDRWLAELARLVGGWDGQLAVLPDGDGYSVAVSTTGAGGSPEEFLAWLGPLLSSLKLRNSAGEPIDLRGQVALEEVGDLRRVVDGEGRVVATIGSRGGASWLSFGAREAAPAAMDDFLRALERAPSAREPAIRVRLTPFGVTDEVTVRVEGDRLRFESALLPEGAVPAGFAPDAAVTAPGPESGR